MKPGLWILPSALGGRHRYLRPGFTITHPTQRVCFDWGREFELPEVQATRSGVADNVRPPTNTVAPAEASAG
jgi:hypothetical protein